jgi:hypothetical protein
MDVDAMQVTHRMNDIWGISIDWHNFSAALEYMCYSSSEAELSNSRRTDGMTRYIIH